MDNDNQNIIPPPVPGTAAIEDEWPWPQYPKNHGRNRLTADRARGQRSTGWEGDFLDAFRNTGIVRSACLSARISAAIVRGRRSDDPDFSTAYEEARDQACDALEAAAFQRAVHGTRRERPIYFGGKLVTTEIIIEYSDTLLIFLLKANRPQKFRENVDRKHDLVVLQEEARRIAREEGLDESAVVAEATRIFNKGK